MDHTIAQRQSFAYSQADVGEFERQVCRAQLGAVLAWLTRRPNALLNLNQVVEEYAIGDRTYVGIQVVPIAKIRGSEGRWTDFDAQFRPRKEHTRTRWINIARARRLDIPLPAVDLVRIGDTYFVRDGNHRVSVARALGQKAIDANVTVWECPTFEQSNRRRSASMPLATRGRVMWGHMAHTVGAWLIALGTRLQAGRGSEKAVSTT